MTLSTFCCVFVIWPTVWSNCSKMYAASPVGLLGQRAGLAECLLEGSCMRCHRGRIPAKGILSWVSLAEPLWWTRPLAAIAGVNSALVCRCWAIRQYTPYGNTVSQTQVSVTAGWCADLWSSSITSQHSRAWAAHGSSGMWRVWKNLQKL